MSIYYFKARQVRCAYFNLTAKILSKNVLELERRLELLEKNVQVVSVKSLDDKALLPCDLLIVSALNLAEAELLSWLQKYRKKSLSQKNVLIPLLLIHSNDELSTQNFFDEAFRAKWFFDLCSEKHLSSLTIRAANLIRVHDLLHDLKRRDEMIASLKKHDSINKEK